MNTYTMSCRSNPEGGQIAGLNGGAHISRVPRSSLLHAICPCGAPLMPDDWSAYHASIAAEFQEPHVSPCEQQPTFKGEHSHHE